MRVAVLFPVMSGCNRTLVEVQETTKGADTYAAWEQSCGSGVSLCAKADVGHSERLGRIAFKRSATRKSAGRLEPDGP
jgi:hypothetical protein